MLADYRLATKAEVKQKGKAYAPSEDFMKFSHFHVYLFLKKRFGKVNPSKWVTLDSDGLIESSGKVQWLYFIRMPHGLLEIYDYKREHCIFASYTLDQGYTGSEMPAELVDDLKVFINELRQFITTIHVQEKSAFNGHIIINPFEVHYRNASYHLRKLRNLARKELTTHGYYERMKLHNESEYLSYAAFVLLMASVEGFVNLLYELYLRPDIRENNSIRKKIVNDKLDFKIKMLPIYCSVFKNRWRENDPIYVELKRLMTLRNEIVHADFIDNSYMTTTVEDGFLFHGKRIGKEEEYTVYFGYPRHSLPFIIKSKEIIDSAIRKIVDLLETKQRRRFKQVIHDYYIGYYLMNGEVSFYLDRLWF